MAIKVVIARKVTADKAVSLKPLLMQLRTLAIAQPGYISGETLSNVENPEEVIVISTWATLADWNAWLADPRREQVQAQLDELLGGETAYQAYQHC